MKKILSLSTQRWYKKRKKIWRNQKILLSLPAERYDMDKKRKEKFGELLLDVAKYIITAVILTSLFQGFAEWTWYAYFIAMVAVSLLIWGSLQLFSEDKDKNKKKKGK